MALGTTNISECWGEVLKLNGWLATFRISHHDTIIQQRPPGIDGNDIVWRIFDKASLFCGVAKLTAVTFEDAAADYACLLISRSRGPDAAMVDTAMWRQPRAVTIRSKEEIPRFLSLPLSSTDWPKKKQMDNFLSFEPRDWAYLNVLVLRYLGAGQIYERIGIGEIHEDAWADSGPEIRGVSII